MKPENSQKYFLTCFLLTIPILVWNLVLTNKLPKDFQPEIFWYHIPTFITYGENISRIILFVFIFLMPLKISTNSQKKGLVLYLIGTLLYFASWLILMYSPDSIWSKSIFGFLAPAYTPLFWLIGIGFIGNSFYFDISFKRWLYFLIVLVFLVFHNWHSYLIYERIN
jgi:hypothetical protein